MSVDDMKDRFKMQVYSSISCPFNLLYFPYSFCSLFHRFNSLTVEIESQRWHMSKDREHFLETHKNVFFANSEVG